MYLGWLSALLVGWCWGLGQTAGSCNGVGQGMPIGWAGLGQPAGWTCLPHLTGRGERTWSKPCTYFKKYQCKSKQKLLSDHCWKKIMCRAKSTKHQMAWVERHLKDYPVLTPCCRLGSPPSALAALALGTSSSGAPKALGILCQVVRHVHI